MESTLEQPLTEARIEMKKTYLLPWIVCFSAALFFFYEFIQMNMFNAINHSLTQTFHLNATQLGNLSANFFYSNLIFLLPAGLILDCFSTKKMILLTLSICVFGTFLFAGTNHLFVAQISRFLTGIGSAFCFLGPIRLASRWFPPKRMALISGLIVTMAMAGGMVAQTPMTFLVEALGWRATLYIDAILGIFILGIIWYFVEDYPAEKKDYYESTKNKITDKVFWQNTLKAYLKIQNWLGGFYTSLLNIPFSLFGALWGIAYLQLAHQITAQQASYITSALFLGTIIGSPIAGWISDQMGLRRLPMLIGSLIAFILSLIILYGPFHSIITLIVLFFAFGLISSTQVISYPMVAESNPSALTATSVSVVSFTTIAAYAFSQPIFGWLLDFYRKHSIHASSTYTISNYQHAFLMLPICMALAFIATLLIKETYCKSYEVDKK